MPGDATEMYQEGLILPAVRIFEGGERNRDVWSILLANVRLPGNTEGDIAAQMAGVQTGMRRFHSMLERYGATTVQAGIDEIIAYSERHMRSEIARMPDGDLPVRRLHGHGRDHGPAGEDRGDRPQVGQRHRVRLHRLRPAGRRAPSTACSA